MKVLVISKSNLNVLQIDNVTSISYSAGIVTITAGGTSTTYSTESYNIQILW